MKINWSAFHDKYDEENVRKYTPTKPGVYLLWVKLKEGNKWKCFYCGLADNLEDRLLDHLSDSEKNERIKEEVKKYVCGFEWAEVAKQSDREGIEKFLYDHYKPECNKVDPGGTPTEINLP